MNRSLSLTTLAFTLIATEAFAQGVGIGGGGAGLLAGAIAWVMTNLVAGLIDAAIILVGLAMMFMHCRPTMVASVVIGALIVTNYLAIAGVI